MSQGTGGPWEATVQAPGVGSDLVTGEAVVLELRLAKLPSRAIGLLMDVAAMVVLFLVASWIVGTFIANSVDDAAATALQLVLVVAVIVGYPMLFETVTRGRSLGKLAMGLRVVRDDGGPVRARHSLARALVGVLEIWVTLGSVAVLASLASTKGKRLGDQLGGTVVVR
jgi:uncharacterized RDD family membrane protein YckC